MKDSVAVVRDALPTSRHARMLFSMVQGRLGDHAYVESWNDQAKLLLYSRSGDDYVPWPRLSLGLGGRLSHVQMIRGPEEAPRPQVPASRLRNLGPGEIIVHDAAESITVTYGDDGRCFETARSEDPLPGVAEAIMGGPGGPTERLAEFVAQLEHEPAAVHMPVPLPGALQTVWSTGRRAIRHALFHGRVPRNAGWVAADGYDGVALGWGATRDEALAHWRTEVERLQPRPPQPQPPAEAQPLPPGARIMQAPRADGERPDPAPENTPAAVVRLHPLPERPTPFGEWVRVLGDYGAIEAAARRSDVAGFTMIGQQLLEALGTEGLKTVDEALGREPPLPYEPLQPGREFNCLTTWFELEEDAGGSFTATPRETSRSDGFDPDRLRAEALRRYIVRQVWRDLDA